MHQHNDVERSLSDKSLSWSLTSAFCEERRYITENPKLGGPIPKELGNLTSLEALWVPWLKCFQLLHLRNLFRHKTLEVLESNLKLLETKFVDLLHPSRSWTSDIFLNILVLLFEDTQDSCSCVHVRDLHGNNHTGSIPYELFGIYTILMEL